ncbi:hypothetical protein GCM10007394_10620 [Salinibacterium amurskyense]|nr:DUF4190 domain-containing protein [Salinibacterium amurskyense]GHD80048.1 hypothetical protein GCM10007394_10620 [Salinibacterium amurskyense]
MPPAPSVPPATAPSADNTAAEDATAAPVAPEAAPAAAPSNPYASTNGTPVPGYASGPTPGQAAYSPVPAGPPKGLSIASMATGISSVVLTFMALGFLPGIAAVVLGHMAQKKQPYARPLWLTGLITGYIATALGLLTIVGWIVFFIFLANASYDAPYYGGY